MKADAEQAAVRPRGDRWVVTLLHSAAVAAAVLALVGALSTVAGQDQLRPRLQAMALAGVSLAASLSGWRYFERIGRIDAVLAAACSTWVLVEAAWYTWNAAGSRCSVRLRATPGAGDHEPAV